MDDEKKNLPVQSESPIPPQPKKGNFFFETLKFVFISLLIVVPFRYFIAQPFIVSGASMEPTFTDGEYLIVDEISYHIEDPKRDDVVIFKYPLNTAKYFIKRIIGLPGETVIIQDGVITIKEKNGQTETLNEDYIKNIKRDNFTATLGDNEYFVLGDNRPNSADSRSWGPLPRDLIVGRPFLRLLPIKRVDIFPGVPNQVN